MGKCDNCIKRQNESCYLLGDHPDCTEYAPAFPKIHESPRKMRTRIDSGTRNLMVSRYVFADLKDSEFQRKAAKTVEKNAKTAQHLPYGLRIGKTLYYVRKSTGDVERGVIEEGDEKEFLLRTASGTRSYAYVLIGKRLFRTEERAQQEARKWREENKAKLPDAVFDAVAGGMDAPQPASGIEQKP